MSKRDKEAHAEKEAARKRWYPQLGVIDLQQRLEQVHNVVHFLGEDLNVGLMGGRVAEEQSRMFGAHMTIGIYALNRMMDMYQRELVLAQKESELDLITIPAGLVDPKGRPIA